MARAPFFNLLVIFYLFGAAIPFVFLLFGPFNLSIIADVIWTIVVILSLSTTVKRFIQSVARDWGEEVARSRTARAFSKLFKREADESDDNA